MQVCNPARAKHIVTAACRKAVQMLRPSCYSGLQLWVAKHIVMASRKVVLSIVPRLHYAELQLEVAKRIALAAGREDLSCRSATEEVAQRRSSWENRCLSQEVAQ